MAGRIGDGTEVKAAARIGGVDKDWNVGDSVAQVIRYLPENLRGESGVGNYLHLKRSGVVEHLPGKAGGKRWQVDVIKYAAAGAEGRQGGGIAGFRRVAVQQANPQSAVEADSTIEGDASRVIGAAQSKIERSAGLAVAGGGIEVKRADFNIQCAGIGCS